ASTCLRIRGAKTGAHNPISILNASTSIRKCAELRRRHLRMNNLKYRVTTSVGGVAKSQIWDSGEPMKIGHPVRFVLTRTNKGFLVTDAYGKPLSDKTPVTLGTQVALPVD